MASQDDSGSVPFGFAHQQQAYRLLELPPELLQVVCSDNPPPLTLKSAIPPPHTSTAPQAHAVLCTPSQTYRIRQVHSSNSIFLLRPTPGQESGLPPEVGVSVIASAKATLELQLTSTPSAALPYLRQQLPLYKALQDEDGDFEMMSSPVVRKEQRPSRVEAFENIPVSDEECEQAWIGMCAFEDHSGAFRPSPASLVDLWRAIFSAATAGGLPLDSPFLGPDLWKLLSGDGHAYPQPLFDAVLLRLRPTADASDDEWTRIDRAQTVPWIGSLILESHQQSRQDLGLSAFLRDWADTLPEAWRGGATSLDLLAGKCWQPSPSTVRFGQKEAGMAAPDSGKGAGQAAKGKKKWHDKFRPG
ncbi:MAG: hypothetical protein M1832_000549 [Thelocarpon impressellum]|nr:MAG: hypothetical protein M1832_000549 [Thelocarpon impressellum]